MLDGFQGGWVYSRMSNLTEESVECAINVLERGAGSLVFSSGMGTISAVLFGFLKAGDHVVSRNSLTRLPTSRFLPVVVSVFLSPPLSSFFFFYRLVSCFPPSPQFPHLLLAVGFCGRRN